MTKRLREDENSGDVDLYDENNEAIPVAVIAADPQLTQQALRIVLQYGAPSAFGFERDKATDYRVLGTLQTMSSGWNNFIRDANLWKALFERDYPRQAQAAGADSAFWESVKQRLDQLSPPGKRGPERKTYWKRWYELMKRPFSYFTKREEVLHLEHDGRWSLDDTRMLGKYGNRPTKAILYHDKYSTDVVFLVPTTFIDVVNHIDAVDFPVNMVKIDMQTLTGQYVPYDETQLGRKILPMQTWKSFDGFAWFGTAVNRMFFKNSIALDGNPFNGQLVSCQQCQVNAAEYRERNLGGLFCSAECQREFRLIGRQDPRLDLLRKQQSVRLGGTGEERREMEQRHQREMSVLLAKIQTLDKPRQKWEIENLKKNNNTKRIN
jgi:hypothetical protein